MPVAARELQASLLAHFGAEKAESAVFDFGVAYPLRALAGSRSGVAGRARRSSPR